MIAKMRYFHFIQKEISAGAEFNPLASGDLYFTFLPADTVKMALLCLWSELAQNSSLT